MKVSAGEEVKSCGIHTSLWTWESHAVGRFRFRRAVDVGIKQVGMFTLWYVFIAFVVIHQGHERKEINLYLATF